MLDPEMISASTNAFLFCHRFENSSPVFPELDTIEQVGSFGGLINKWPKECGLFFGSEKYPVCLVLALE